MGRFEGSRGGRDSGRSYGGRDSRRGRSDSRGSSRRDSSYSRDSSRSSYGRRDSGSSYGSRDPGRSSYGGRSSRGRDSGRRDNDIEMTKVICASCNQECEIPFKPKTDKPVYCRDCYSKEGNGGRSNGRSSRSFNGGSNSGISEKDLDQINEKLNKILKALKVE